MNTKSGWRCCIMKPTKKNGRTEDLGAPGCPWVPRPLISLPRDKHLERISRSCKWMWKPRSSPTTLVGFYRDPSIGLVGSPIYIYIIYIYGVIYDIIHQPTEVLNTAKVDAAFCSHWICGNDGSRFCDFIQCQTIDSTRFNAATNLLGLGYWGVFQSETIFMVVLLAS